MSRLTSRVIISSVLLLGAVPIAWGDDDGLPPPVQYKIDPGQHPPNAAPDKPQAPPDKPQPAPANADPIDLLKLADLKAPSTKGHWDWSEIGLESGTTPDTPSACSMEFPADPTGDYELDLTINRTSGKKEIGIAFPAGAPARVSIGGLTGQTSNIEGTDSQTSDRVLTNNQDMSFKIRVRRAGTTSQINVLLDGKPYLNWSGAFDGLNIKDPPSDHHIQITVHPESTVLIRSLRLIPLAPAAQAPPAIAGGAAPRSPDLPAPKPGTPTAPPPDAPSSPPVPPAPPDQAGVYDLLKEVDLKSDTTRGQWKQTDDGLVSLQSGDCKIEMPAPPISDYDLEINFTRVAGGKEFIVVFPAGESAQLWFGGMSGQDSSIMGTTARINENLIKNNQAMTLKLHVTNRSGQSFITVKLDGQPYLNWSGKQTRLKSRDISNRFKLSDPSNFAIVVHDQSSVSFHSIKLTPATQPAGN